jgi:hypothetical protein
LGQGKISVLKGVNIFKFTQIGILKLKKGESGLPALPSESKIIFGNHENSATQRVKINSRKA